MSLKDNNSQNNDKQSADINNPLTIFIIAIVFLVVAGGVMFYIDSQTNTLRTGQAHADDSEGLASRLQPVAKFAYTEAEPEDAPLKSGKEVYDLTCVTCHDAGVAGAPKFGDQAAWAPYIATGYEEMLRVALNGQGAMPAKGGNSSLKDLEVELAMVYMANEAGAGFAEPGTDGADNADSAAASDAADESSTDVAAADSGSSIPAATDEQLQIGETLYSASCFACHGTGVAGAPKIGDKADWGPYMDTGLDTMLQIAITGKGAMPPRGTAINASDEELESAILYMIQDAR